MRSRAGKEAEIAALRDRFARAGSVFLVHYRGLDVVAVDALRRQLHSEGEGAYEYRVSKNTLIQLAIRGSAAEALGASVSGPTALAFCYGDPVSLAKILVAYANQHEFFALRAGWVEGSPVGDTEIALLATLPPLAGLRARLAQLVQAPAAQLATLAAAPAAQLARLLDARRERLEGDEPGG